MRTSLSPCFLITLGLLTSISVSLSLAQDSDGSGLDLEIYDSGDGSEDDSDSTSDMTLDDRRHRDVFHPSSSVINPPADESEWIFIENSKSLLENPEIRTGVISGGVTGVMLAVAITAMLIYKWQKKETERFVQSKRKDSDEKYLSQRKGDFIV